MGIDDIIKSLECCGQEDSKGCNKCPLRTEHSGVCIKAKAKAAEIMKQQQQKIEELEERIAIIGECKHGQWVDEEEIYGGGLKYIHKACSCCKHRAIESGDYYDYELTNYCPNCGAKMDEEEE